jgi:hypothetical protein
MIFSDISVLNEVICSRRERDYNESSRSNKNSNPSANSKIDKDNQGKFSSSLIFHDSKDPLVDKWYSTSPPITGNAIFTFEFDERSDVEQVDGDRLRDPSMMDKDGDKNIADTYINKVNEIIASLA